MSHLIFFLKHKSHAEHVSGWTGHGQAYRLHLHFRRCGRVSSDWLSVWLDILLTRLGLLCGNLMLVATSNKRLHQTGEGSLPRLISQRGVIRDKDQLGKLH